MSNEFTMRDVESALAEISHAARTSVGELRAEVLDLQQRAARRGSAGSALESGQRLSDAAEPLALGMLSANSAKAVMPFGIRAALSGTGAGGSVQYPMPAKDLGAVNTTHSPAVRLLDLLPAESVEGANTVSYVRVSLSTNAAAVAPELSAKGESAIATQLIVEELATWAHYVQCSRQVLADVGTLRTTIDTLLANGLLDKIDVGAFAALTTAGNFTAYAATAGDTIGDAVARISARLANLGGKGIVVALNPVDYLSMTLQKAAGGGTYLGVPPNLASTIAAVASVTQGSVLAFAPTTGAAFADRQSVTVESGYSGTGFTENRAVLLCEARGSTFVRDPALVLFGALPVAA